MMPRIWIQESLYHVTDPVAESHQAARGLLWETRPASCQRSLGNDPLGKHCLSRRRPSPGAGDHGTPGANWDQAGADLGHSPDSNVRGCRRMPGIDGDTASVSLD